VCVYVCACMCVCVKVCVYVSVCVCERLYDFIHVLYITICLLNKIIGLFCKETYKRDAILQKRPII